MATNAALKEVTNNQPELPLLFSGMQKKKTESVYYTGDYTDREKAFEKIEQAFEAMDSGETRGFSVKIVNNGYRVRASVPKEKK